jgi:uncharacterized membrane protein HdeD (DUF308 family)
MPTDFMNISWKILALRGVLALLFGVVAITWPASTVLGLAVLWGVWALIDGIGLLVQAFSGGSTGNRVLLGILGVIALVVAFWAIVHPSVAAATLIWILGIWLIVRGIFEVVGAFSASAQAPRWLLLLSAALDFLLGILFVANPGQSAVGLAVFLGVLALIWGAVFLMMAFAIRRAIPADATL